MVKSNGYFFLFFSTTLSLLVDNSYHVYFVRSACFEVHPSVVSVQVRFWTWIHYFFSSYTCSPTTVIRSATSMSHEQIEIFHNTWKLDTAHLCKIISCIHNSVAKVGLRNSCLFISMVAACSSYSLIWNADRFAFWK